MEMNINQTLLNAADAGLVAIVKLLSKKLYL